MGGGVVHIGRQPDHVADAPAPDEAQQFGQLQFPAQGGTVIAVGAVLEGVRAIGHDQADGHVRGDDFPGGRGAGQSLLEPSQLFRSQIRRLRALVSLGVGGVGAAKAAQVDAEDFQRAAVAEFLVQPGARFVADRHVVDEGPFGAGRQQIHLRHAVARIGQDFPRIPVVHHFMIVPLGVDRHFGIEAAQILIQQVVGILAMVFRLGFGHLGLGSGSEIAPGTAVGQRHRLGQRAIGIDAVAAVDEKVRTQPTHGLEDAHAAQIRVDPPALAANVSRPQETHVATAQGGHLELAQHRLARPHRAIQRLEGHAAEDAFAMRQALQVELGREIALRKRRRPPQPHRIAEAFGGGHLQPHPRWPIGPAPNHGAIIQHIPDLHPAGNLHPAAIRPTARHEAGKRRGNRHASTRHGHLAQETPSRCIHGASNRRLAHDPDPP